MPSRRESARCVSSLDALSTTITSCGTSRVWAAIARKQLLVYSSLLKTGTMIETSGARILASAGSRPRPLEIGNNVVELTAYVSRGDAEIAETTGSERNLAQNPRSGGAGHLGHVAGVPEQRLVGQHRERDRFLGVGVD